VGYAGSLSYDRLPPELNDMSSALTKVERRFQARCPGRFPGTPKALVLAVRQVLRAARLTCGAAWPLTQCVTRPRSSRRSSAQGGRNTLCVRRNGTGACPTSDRWFGTAEDYARSFEKEFKYPVNYGFRRIGPPPC